MGNAPSAVPFGAQSNLLNFSAPCTFNGNKVFVQTTLSATSPLSGGSGQQIYYSDIAASITFPPEVRNYAQSLTQYQAKIEIALDGQDISPKQSKLSYSTGYNSFNSPGPSVAWTAAPLGPFTLTGPAGQVGDLRVPGLSVTLQYAAVDNTNIGPPQSLVCDGFLNPPIVSGTTITTATGPALKPSIGATGNFPSTPGDIGGSYFSLNGTRSVVANLPIVCTESENYSKGQRFNYTFQGSSPVQTLSGQYHNINNVQNFFTIPGNVAYTLNSRFKNSMFGARTSAIFVNLGRDVNGKDLPGKGLGADLIFSSIGGVDIARQFTASDANTPNPLSTGYYTDAGSSAPVTFALPKSGSLALPNYSTYQSGNSIFSFKPKNIQGAINGYSVDYTQPTYQENFNCSLDGDFFLLRAPIITFSFAVPKAK